jgi:hypothetical protein
MSISCTTPSMTCWCADRPSEVRLAVPIVSARISAVFHGVIRNSWKSGRYPFAGLTVAICW